ncbi:MAG: hypothetical protein AUG44_17685 [Actinobacteria bacterium 13_1_20CM_3_71_11]|nr:MAG: hypothetical protein AUG44_17685 [Actinobacteria bacterium 13_1_20CM_3_71_11]TML31830.1 MAG: hypothetical protein E6G35_03495 [Actinomycetota bacterium]
MSYYGPEEPGQASDPWEHSAPVPYDVDLGYPEPPTAESRGSRALLIVLVGVLVVILCGGGVGALYLIGAKDNRPPANPALAQTHPPSASASPTFDPNSIIKGQCLVNEGTDDQPTVRVTGCTPGTLKVLSRIDATSDKDQCKKVPGANRVYFYKTTPDSLSFVLCLQTVS